MEGRSPGDSFGKEGVPADLTKTLAEPAVRVEPTEHLDEERAEALPGGADSLPNRRNGSNPKTATTDSGKVLPGIPRDRNGSFDPIPIAKDRWRFPKVDTRIVSLYAHGMTTRQSQIEAIHGIEASPTPISAIADAGMDAVTAWQNRPLEPCYPVVFMGAIWVGIRRCRTRAVFVASAILPDGSGDVLGLWFRVNEGATVRAKGLNAPRNRSVQDIPIAVVDGIKGFPIEAAFPQRPSPQTQPKTCIGHLPRHSMSFASLKGPWAPWRQKLP